MRVNFMRYARCISTQLTHQTNASNRNLWYLFIELNILKTNILDCVLSVSFPTHLPKFIFFPNYILILFSAFNVNSRYNCVSIPRSPDKDDATILVKFHFAKMLL